MTSQQEIDKRHPTIAYSGTTYLSTFGDDVAYVRSGEQYGDHYGWQFSFSTSPTASITTYAMTHANFWLWIEGESATTYTILSSLSSGSGT